MAAEIHHPATSSGQRKWPESVLSDEGLVQVRDDHKAHCDLLHAAEASPTSQGRQHLVALRDHGREGRPKRHTVWLNVYDIDEVTAQLNAAGLHAANIGVYHCGVEVMGDEWFFAWGATNASGVWHNQPKGHGIHIFKESLCMGESELADTEIREVLAELMEEWAGNSYHPVTRNCIDFAEAVILALRCQETMPSWVRGAVDLGKSPILYPLADMGWQMMKWWRTRPRSEYWCNCQVKRCCNDLVESRE